MRNKTFKRNMTYFGMAMGVYTIAILVCVALRNAYPESTYSSFFMLPPTFIFMVALFFQARASASVHKNKAETKSGNY